MRRQLTIIFFLLILTNLTACDLFDSDDDPNPSNSSDWDTIQWDQDNWS